MLNAPFCPVKQKLCRNECKVSMVKIPQHKVTKSLLIDNGFFKIQTSSSSEATETMYRVFGKLRGCNLKFAGVIDETPRAFFKHALDFIGICIR